MAPSLAPTASLRAASAAATASYYYYPLEAETS